ncbi:protein PSK SIMULATOR 1-like isoform X1 [Typha latifolia]|uniref:protein PSK SIMULATOR 1-like isoform X1 n=1 Tax=Typha latifolia TaxID=4733 RepID=UPI003C2BCC2E
MGGTCSKGSPVKESPGEISFNAIGFGGNEVKPLPFHGNVPSKQKTAPVEETTTKKQSFSFSDKRCLSFEGNQACSFVSSQKPKVTKSKPAATAKTGTIKVSEVSSLLGRASTAGLGKAVEVLDTLGSSMTNLNPTGGFVSGGTTKGNKVSILAFEVANTIVKGYNLMQSLSKENIKYLKEVVLPSEAVQRLVSKNMEELLRIAAADKRQELKVFSREIIRFGNRCKDPQWHNLDRYFAKLESEITPQKQLKETAAGEMQHLITLVQHTAELYHELHALDRFEQDYRRKLQEQENSVAFQEGDTLQILRQEVKSQRKHVRGLKKKSLWSKILEDVMEKLVDIFHFLHLEIHDAFGSFDGGESSHGSINKYQRLGSAGLALHYANIISQISSLVSRSCSMPPSNRDALYQALPPSIKSALRTKLQSYPVIQELQLTGPQIRAEMEKTLQWLVPVANNTARAHHGFGWVGEWANTGSELNLKSGGQIELIKIETLHHADKQKTEEYILELVVLLHHLISQSRPLNGGSRSPIKSPIRSPPQKSSTITLIPRRPSSPLTMLTKEDQEMLRDMNFRKLTPVISKSQDFDTNNSRLRKHDRLSKSSSHSPTSKGTCELSLKDRSSVVPEADFDIDRIKSLDVIDRVEMYENLHT